MMNYFPSTSRWFVHWIFEFVMSKTFRKSGISSARKLFFSTDYLQTLLCPSSQSRLLVSPPTFFWVKCRGWSRTAFSPSAVKTPTNPLRGTVSDPTSEKSYYVPLVGKNHDLPVAGRTKRGKNTNLLSGTRKKEGDRKVWRERGSRFAKQTLCI